MTTYKLDLTQMRNDIGTENVNELEPDRTEVVRGLTGIADIVVKNIDPRIKLIESEIPEIEDNIGNDYPLDEKGSIKVRLDKLEKFPPIIGDPDEYPSIKGTISKRLDDIESEIGNDGLDGSVPTGIHGDIKELDDKLITEKEVIDRTDTVIKNLFEFTKTPVPLLKRDDGSWNASWLSTNFKSASIWKFFLLQFAENDDETFFKFWGHIDTESMSSEQSLKRQSIGGSAGGVTYGIPTNFQVLSGDNLVKMRNAGKLPFKITPLGIIVIKNSNGSVTDVSFSIGAVGYDGKLYIDCQPSSVGDTRKIPSGYSYSWIFLPGLNHIKKMES